MRTFTLDRPQSVSEAIGSMSPDAPDGRTHYLAGGTTLVDLMKLDVMRPDRLVSLGGLGSGPHESITVNDGSLRLGALVRMSDAADHPVVRRDYPVIAESLILAASAQLRNAATLGGNVLQRTRCSYYRDVSFACNRREPGTGCAALKGRNRSHAVLGTSDSCIATYAGDFAQALTILDAVVELVGPEGEREIEFGELHRLPADAPHLEHNLRPGELITAFRVPSGPWTARSHYLKIRDRASYAFGLVTVAVALHTRDGTIEEARIGLGGGVATVPWRARRAEEVLRGERVSEANAIRAAEAEMETARPRHENAFKVPLAKETLVRAVLHAAELEV